MKLTEPNDSIVGEFSKIGEVQLLHSGLTKREYFAGLALQAIISNNVMAEQINVEVSKQGIKEPIEYYLGLTAVALSEGLIRALNTEKKNEIN